MVKGGFKKVRLTFEFFVSYVMVVRVPGAVLRLCVYGREVEDTRLTGATLEVRVTTT